MGLGFLFESPRAPEQQGKSAREATGLEAGRPKCAAPCGPSIGPTSIAQFGFWSHSGRHFYEESMETFVQCSSIDRSVDLLRGINFGSAGERRRRRQDQRDG